MSNSQMTETFIMPLKTTPGGVMPFLEDSQGCLIAVVEGRHAEAIRRAVNSHDDLYEALESALSALRQIEDEDEWGLADEINDITKLLAKARGES